MYHCVFKELIMAMGVITALSICLKAPILGWPHKNKFQPQNFNTICYFVIISGSNSGFYWYTGSAGQVVTQIGTQGLILKTELAVQSAFKLCHILLLIRYSSIK